MTKTRIPIVAGAWLLVSMAGGQTLNPPARAVITQSRSLTAAEVAHILAAARDAIAGRTFKLSYQPSGPACR